jgi:alpha-N-arabinofuranosidase
MSTTVRFTPDSDGERAGLAAMQSDKNFLFFGITRLAGKPMVALYTTDKGTERLVASAPVATTGPVTLTIRAKGGTMAFDYQAGAARRTLAADVDARFLSTEAAGGFVGTIVGPYAWRR